MRFGVHVFITDFSMGVVELAREVEGRGLDSLWLPEHTHTPVSRQTPYPMGGELPMEYSRCVDPMIGLAMAAAATTRMRVGTGILLAAQRDPIITAKAVASLDQQSGGRVSLGIGFGWNEEEMNDHGVVMSRRRDMAREHVRAMQALWAEDESSFDGEFVAFEPTWMWPKPAQTSRAGRPGVPVYVGGGNGPQLFRHVVEYADGWMPMGVRGLEESATRLRREAEAAGRDPATIQIVPFGTGPNHGKFDHFEKLDVSEVLFNLPHGRRDEVLPELDRIAAFVSERRS